MGEEKNWHHPASSFMERVYPTHYCSRSPQRKANGLSSCIPSFGQIPALTLSVPEPSSHLAPQFSCVLSLAGDCDSKPQILKGQAWSRPALFLCPSLACPRKVVTWHAHSGWNILWHTVKSCDQVICSLCVPLFQKSSHTRQAKWLESTAVNSKKLQPVCLPSAGATIATPCY